MLDVHAPEHGIGGARDFFMHLLTITVGFCLSRLSLENGCRGAGTTAINAKKRTR